MAVKQVLIPAICLLLASVGILCSDREFGKFIEYQESNEIALSKLNRLLQDEDLGNDEYTIAHNVVKELARTIFKSETNSVAGKYSVYELLDMNSYWSNYLHYCSPAEVEIRQRRCDDLSESDKDKNLMHYCLYCASQYFEICQENVEAILIKRVLDKHRVSVLMLKNIKWLVENFETWILRDGYEHKDHVFNFNEFMKDPKNIPATWNSIKKTCMEVLEQLNDVLFFESTARLSVQYLKERLPDEHKDKAVVGHCGTFLKATVPNLSQHPLLKVESAATGSK